LDYQGTKKTQLINNLVGLKVPNSALPFIQLNINIYKGTFGYHADDGIAFCDDTEVIRNFGPIWAKENATVGCGVDFEARKSFHQVYNLEHN
jgi:hypothetical protein